MDLFQGGRDETKRISTNKAGHVISGMEEEFPSNLVYHDLRSPVTGNGEGKSAEADFVPFVAAISIAGQRLVPFATAISIAGRNEDNRRRC
jgi:hypothetical protein